MRTTTTTNEKEIRRWATQHNAHPITKSPYTPDGVPAELGFVFGDAPEAEEHLKPISWAEFFALFQLVGLALVLNGGSDYSLVKLDEEPGGRFEGKPVQA